ncbi:hypothetical protein [Aureimonas glaciei]|uniref:Uncharacterized protein n=1 Tax=Aureimonas glaciei TaxID=1776957 RepID=A0A916Y9J7_9HYPH|nr:hypothetical protein [Aureimonas glaciei]GGD35839.1 hypothetical protein GCM10011335_43530 [Aureimonas glaciei]
MAVLAEEIEVAPRLEQLGVTKNELLQVVRAAVGARRNATPFHPLSAGGLLAYLAGTEHLRRVYVPQGWEICRRDNIESIFHKEIGIKIVYQNAERAGDPISDPIAVSKKGAGAARAVELGQYDLFPEVRELEVAEITAATWYLFVYAVGPDVRAELSCPVAINDEQFDQFHERILLVQRGEWDSPDPLADEAPPVEFEVNVSRKI